MLIPERLLLNNDNCYYTKDPVESISNKPRKNKIFDQLKTPKLKGGHFDPLISLLISRLRFSYVCLRGTFRGILEGYFDEKMIVLGQSSAN